MYNPSRDPGLTVSSRLTYRESAGAAGEVKSLPGSSHPGPVHPGPGHPGQPCACFHSILHRNQPGNFVLTLGLSRLDCSITIAGEKFVVSLLVPSSGLGCQSCCQPSRLSSRGLSHLQRVSWSSRNQSETSPPTTVP